MPETVYPLGTVVFVPGISSPEESYLGVVIDEEVWIEKAQLMCPAMRQLFQAHKLQGTHLTPLRILGVKVFDDIYSYSPYSPTGDPERAQVWRFSFRQTNMLTAYWKPSDGPDVLDHFHRLLMNFSVLVGIDSYIKSIDLDLTLLSQYYRGNYDLASDNLSYYIKQFMRCLIRELPNTKIPAQTTTV